MTVDPGQFRPYGSQIESSLRNLDAHDLFHGLAVTQAVHEAAQAADPVGHMRKVDKIPMFDQPLQPPVHVAD
jgi:hypothetical protein